MLSVGKVNTFLGFQLMLQPKEKKNFVNNKLKLIFTPKTTLLSVIDDCPHIPYQHLLPFVLLCDVPPRSQTHDNVIGMYNLHFKV